MRLAWVTPSHSGTAIATYSRHVVAALRRHADVDVWAPAGEPDHDVLEPQRRLDATRDEPIDGYDHVIYNMGNHPGFHREIYLASRRQAGIVVLHDRSLSGFFLGQTLPGGSLEATLAAIEADHGPELRTYADDYAHGRLGRHWASSDTLLRLPFTAEAMAGQRAAVTHSAIHAEEVMARWDGPVLGRPLPVYPDLLDLPPAPPRDAHPVTLVSEGILNANKRVDEVIEALGADPDLARRVRYRIVGPPGDEAYACHVRSLIDRHGLGTQVEMLGAQPVDVLTQIVREADIHLNLRYPSLEGGSASASEQLASGRPVVVYDTGVLAELPPAAALKVPVGDRPALAEALWQLVADPDLRARMGAAGRREAEARTAEAYVTALLGFLSPLPPKR